MKLIKRITFYHGTVTKGKEEDFKGLDNNSYLYDPNMKLDTICSNH